MREIEAPASTAWPLVLAVGFTLIFAGLLTSVSVSELGSVLAVAGCAGWFREVLPKAHEVAMSVVPDDGVVITKRRMVDRLPVAPDQVRAWLPLRTHPISAGLKGGLAGGMAIFMGTVMGVVQVTVQAVAGQRMLGTGAAMVQFSRSVGAAFGTAAVAAVLFSVLAAGDRETAGLFGALIDQGPDAIAALPVARQTVVQGEIAGAFRAAFVTIAAFTAIGAWLAWSMPLRRV